jgi:hypothetical protein
MGEREFTRPRGSSAHDMPGMAKFVLSREIQQRWPDLLLMTVTAYGMTSEGKNQRSRRLVTSVKLVEIRD